VRLRRVLGHDLLGGQEAESGGQRGFGQVAQLAQALHEAHVPRAESGIGHDGNFPGSKHGGPRIFLSRRLVG
jgi:hypothetical protein